MDYREKAISEIGCKYVREDLFHKDKFTIVLPNKWIAMLSFSKSGFNDTNDNSVLSVFDENRESVLHITVDFKEACNGIKNYCEELLTTTNE